MSLALASFLTPRTEYGSLAEAARLAEEEKARVESRGLSSWFPHELQHERERVKGRERLTRDREEAGGFDELDVDVSTRALDTLAREVKERPAADGDAAHSGEKRPTAPRAADVGMTSARPLMARLLKYGPWWV